MYSKVTYFSPVILVINLFIDSFRRTFTYSHSFKCIWTFLWNTFLWTVLEDKDRYSIKQPHSPWNCLLEVSRIKFSHFQRYPEEKELWNFILLSITLLDFFFKSSACEFPQNFLRAIHLCWKSLIEQEL